MLPVDFLKFSLCSSSVWVGSNTWESLPVSTHSTVWLSKRDFFSLTNGLCKRDKVDKVDLTSRNGINPCCISSLYLSSFLFQHQKFFPFLINVYCTGNIFP